MKLEFADDSIRMKIKTQTRFLVALIGTCSFESRAIDANTVVKSVLPILRLRIFGASMRKKYQRSNCV